MRNKNELNAEQILLINHKLIGHCDWYGETNHDNESEDNIPVLGNVIYNLLNDLSAPIYDYISNSWNGSASMLYKTSLSEFECIEELVKSIREDINLGIAKNEKK